VAVKERMAGVDFDEGDYVSADECGAVFVPVDAVRAGRSVEEAMHKPCASSAAMSRTPPLITKPTTEGGTSLFEALANGDPLTDLRFDMFDTTCRSPTFARGLGIKGTSKCQPGELNVPSSSATSSSSRVISS